MFFLMIGSLFYSISVFANCDWVSMPEFVEKNGSYMVYSTVFNSQDYFISRDNQEINNFEINKFKDWLAFELPNINVYDQKELLERQRKMYAGDREHDLDSNFYQQYLKRYDLLLGDELGDLTTLSCFEHLLISFHEQQRPGALKDSEVGAFVLLDHSFDQPLFLTYIILSKGYSVPKIDTFPYILEKLSDGPYEYWLNFHTHPFITNNASGDIGGTTVPSGSTIRQGAVDSWGDLGNYQRGYQEHQLTHAWISNVFTTLRILAKDAELFD